MRYTLAKRPLDGFVIAPWRASGCGSNSIVSFAVRRQLLLKVDPAYSFNYELHSLADAIVDLRVCVPTKGGHAIQESQDGSQGWASHCDDDLPSSMSLFDIADSIRDLT